MKIYGQAIAPEIEAAAERWILDRPVYMENDAHNPLAIFTFEDLRSYLELLLPGGIDFVLAERLLGRLNKRGRLRNLAKGIFAIVDTNDAPVEPDTERRASFQDWRCVPALTPSVITPSSAQAAQGMPPLTDAEWRRLEPLIPPSRTGRSRKTDMRRVMNALLYLMHTSWYWPGLPRRVYPPRTTVSWFFNDFRREGQWPALQAELNAVIWDRSAASRRSLDRAAYDSGPLVAGADPRSDAGPIPSGSVVSRSL